MSKIVDAMGQKCPIPVIMAKKEIAAGETAFTMAVDNEIAVANLKKLASSQGYAAADTKVGENAYQVAFTRTADAAGCGCTLMGETWALFFGKDFVGDGDRTLGRSLAQMMLYTISEGADKPESILLMNAGVKLAAEDEQCIQHLKNLEAQGVNILVCGTCLNFFGIADKLAVGTVSNMYAILEKMQQAGKVITA